MFVVDTNVFIHALNRRSPHHERARGAIRAWGEGAEPWFTTWPILYELLRVATHARVFEQPRTLGEAWAFVEALLALPSFSVLTETKRHAAVVADLGAEYPWVAGSIVHDFHTVALMREHGIVEIRTADRDFLPFEHLRVINPFAG